MLCCWVTICRACRKEVFFSAVTFCTSFSRSHTGHSLEEAPWGPEQFAHCCSSPRHVFRHSDWQTASFLHYLELWPNFWHLKHLSGFCMYRSTLTRMYPTLMWAGAVSVLNVSINVFGLRRSVLLSDLTVIWKQSVTRCERRPSLSRQKWHRRRLNLTSPPNYWQQSTVSLMPKPDIVRKSRFLPQLGAPRRDIARMIWLPDCEFGGYYYSK